MTFGLTKGRKLCYIITHKIICANQNTESFVYRWVNEQTTFNIMRFSAFVGASNVISSVQSIDQLSWSLTICISRPAKILISQ